MEKREQKNYAIANDKSYRSIEQDA